MINDTSINQTAAHEDSGDGAHVMSKAKTKINIGIKSDYKIIIYLNH